MRRIAVFAPPGGEMERALVTEPAVLGVEEEGGDGEDCVKGELGSMGGGWGI